MVWAQDEYDPAPPGEPGDVVKSRLHLVSDPEGACTFSQISGTAYALGTSVSVKATPKAGYQFEGWYQAGMLITTELTYTVAKMPYHDMTLTAKLSLIPAPPTPEEPDEPEIPEPNKYQITASAADALSATVTGSGTYEVGKPVTVKATAKSSAYYFLYWTKNGDVTELGQTFTFTLTDDDGDLAFVAWYEYDPATPDEPNNVPVKSHLYLESDPVQGGVFNRTSGTEYVVGSSISVKATPLTEYEFRGWYQNDLLVGEALTYTIESMPYRDVTLVAKWEYVPAPPPPPPAPPAPCFSVSASVGAMTGGTTTCTGTIPKDGAFEVGSQMTVKAMASADFVFLYWTKNGEVTDLPQSFTFTLQESDGHLSFVAWFEYDPGALPDEPDQPEPDPEHKDPEVAQGILTLEPAELSLLVGEQAFLVADLDPFDESAVFTWESSDASVATVDPTGMVTARTLGTTTITVSFYGQTASCEVTVTKPVLLGDVNQDERVSIADVVMLVAHLKGQTSDIFDAKAANVDGNEVVDDEDVKALVELLIQK